jgi:hypothetical protein
VKRIRLVFTPGVETEFVDRDRALAQLAEWAEKGTWAPHRHLRPGGLRQDCLPPAGGSAMLRDLGYDVFYLHPLDRVFCG